MGFVREEVGVLLSACHISIGSLFAAVPWWLWAIQLTTVSLSQMVFFVLMTRLAGNPAITMSEVALGNAMQAVTYSTVFAICSIPGDEKHSGTLQLVMNTPTKVHTVIIGQSLFHILAGVVTVTISLIFASVVFGVDFAQVDMLALVSVIMATIFAMTGFGLMLSSIGIYMRSSTLLASFFLYVGLLFCGVNFPISQLPTILQPVSYVLPMTYGVQGLKMAVNGSSVFSIAPQLSMTILLGSLMIIMGLLMFRKFEGLARFKGSTEMF
jgi:ABC-2 type transport system permease protein